MTKPVTGIQTFAGVSPPWNLSFLDANFVAVVAALNDVGTYGNYLVDSSGAANQLTIATAGSVTFSLVAGAFIQVKAANSTTSSTVNMTVNGGANTAVVGFGGFKLMPGQLLAGGIYLLLYDGTKWQVLNPTPFPLLNPLMFGAVGDGVTDDHVALQAALTAAGANGGTVILPPGYTFFCSADVSVPVAASVGGPVASIQGPGWATISVIFGSGSTFGFTILGTGATTGGVQGSTYNYAGTFRDLGITLTGTSNTAFYVNSVNQPRIQNCWIRGSGSGNSGRGAYFLNCLLPVFEDTLVTGCGSATQYSVEFDSCTTASWRGSRISGGGTTKGGLAIDRCTNFVIDGISSESCGTPIVIGGKAEAALPCTGVIIRGLELENPGNGNPYIDIGAGLSGSALVLDVLLDGMFASPSGTTTIPYAVRMQNISGFEAKGSHFTLAGASTSCFELVGTNVSGIVIRPHRNLQSLAVPWVRYNGTQVLAAGPQMEWQLGRIQAGKPICVSKGLAGIYDGVDLTGATPSILISSTMGGFYSSKGVSNGGATTVTSLSGGEPGMEIVLMALDANTTLTFGNSGGAFRFNGNGGTNIGSNSTLVAGRAYKFFNDGSNGGAGSCWCQM